MSNGNYAVQQSNGSVVCNIIELFGLILFVRLVHFAIVATNCYMFNKVLHTKYMQFLFVQSKAKTLSKYPKTTRNVYTYNIFQS